MAYLGTSLTNLDRERQLAVTGAPPIAGGGVAPGPATAPASGTFGGVRAFFDANADKGDALNAPIAATLDAQTGEAQRLAGEVGRMYDDSPGVGEKMGAALSARDVAQGTLEQANRGNFADILGPGDASYTPGMRGADDALRQRAWSDRWGGTLNALNPATAGAVGPTYGGDSQARAAEPKKPTQPAAPMQNPTDARSHMPAATPQPGDPNYNPMDGRARKQLPWGTPNQRNPWGV